MDKTRLPGEVGPNQPGNSFHTTWCRTADLTKDPLGCPGPPCRLFPGPPGGAGEVDRLVFVGPNDNLGNSSGSFGGAAPCPRHLFLQRHWAPRARGNINRLSRVCFGGQVLFHCASCSIPQRSWPLSSANLRAVACLCIVSSTCLSLPPPPPCQTKVHQTMTGVTFASQIYALCSEGAVRRGDVEEVCNNSQNMEEEGEDGMKTRRTIVAVLSGGWGPVCTTMP